MHDFDIRAGDPPGTPPDNRRWYQMMTRYHWFVLTVAALGWLFDCLDQQLFILARVPAMESLIPAPKEAGAASTEDIVKQRGRWRDIATSVFIAGWACGGLFFGVLGDRIGRAKTMLVTILLYSLCTGLSALSVSVYDFALYRFLTGLGVGGEFAVGVALVAEVMPAGARSQCLSVLQALSAVGNVSAALINLGLGMLLKMGFLDVEPWRIMFVIGAVPALLALVIRSRLKEPEAWQKASHDKAVEKQLGSYRDLFSDPVLRRHAILGLILGCSGIIGLWSVGFFTVDLMQIVQRPRMTVEIYDEERVLARKDGDLEKARQCERLIEQTLQVQLYKEDLRQAQAAGQTTRATSVLEQIKKAESPDLKPLQQKLEPQIAARLSSWVSYVSMMQNLGAAMGMLVFGYLAMRMGRKPTFVIAFLSAFVSTVCVFWFLSDFWQIFVMVPIMGFCQMSLFAGYAIYFPELFPTRLRSTGTSFCYNVGRFAAAFGPLANTFLRWLFDSSSEVMTYRYAGVAMSCVFLVGLLVLPFLPETRGKPLPE
jgi:MFS family permease